jgi:LPXTG-site transpeptidase (sortase) family protein
MNKPIFDENDIRELFNGSAHNTPEPTIGVVFQPSPVKPVRPKYAPNITPFPKVKVSPIKYSYIFKMIFRYIGVFILIFVISFSIINGEALIKEMGYFWNTEYKNTDYIAKNTVVIPTTTTVQESRLLIPKISVSAPITWDVADENINQALENGVAGYKGTALPGQNGNIFITGHSSYYIWAAGNYKDVFALLENVDLGDKIYIQYGGGNFTYEITSKKVVSPNDMSVLNQTNDKTLTLMTCVPVGTNLRRLIVIAKQIK